MILSHKIISISISISALSFAWFSFINYRYTQEPIIEPISLSKKQEYSWSFTPDVSENYELVIRFYKKEPPPYDYVTEILNNSTFNNIPINVAWQLTQGNDTISNGKPNNYGTYFSATNPYIDKGISSFPLESGKPYKLNISVLTGEKDLDILTPEIHITHDAATDLWLFQHTLIAIFVTYLGLAIAVLSMCYLAIIKLQQKYASS